MYVEESASEDKNKALKDSEAKRPQEAMATASEAKGIYVTQELTYIEPMIEEQSTSRICHVHRKEYSLVQR